MPEVCDACGSVCEHVVWDRGSKECMNCYGGRDILTEVFAERRRQDAKWGEQNHAPVLWLAILGEEVGEANKAALEAHFPNYDRYGDWTDYRRELIEVAAVAVAAVESLDRQKDSRFKDSGFRIPDSRFKDSNLEPRTLNLEP